MKIHSSDLFDLIQKLTSKEFEIVLSGLDTKSIESRISLFLLELHRRMSKFDPAVVSTKLFREFPEKKKDGNNYLSNKTQKLIRYIMDILVEKNATKDPEAEIHHLLAIARQLKGMECYSQMKKFLMAAKKLAEEQERYEMQLRILDMLRTELFRDTGRDGKEIAVGSEENLMASSEALALFNMEMSFRSIYMQLMVFARKNQSGTDEEIKAQILEIAKPMLTLKEENVTGFRCRLFYLRCLSAYYQLNQEGIAAFAVRTKKMELWEEFPDFKRWETHNYLVSLSNFLASCNHNSAWPLFEEYLAKLENAAAKTHQEIREKKHNLLYYQFLLAMNQADKVRCDALADSISSELKKGLVSDNKAREFAFFANLAVYYFTAEKWNDCRHWIYSILAHPKVEHRQDIVLMVRILLLIVNAECDEYSLLESSFRSTYRLLYQNPQKPQFEILVLEAIKKVMRLQRKDQFPPILAELNLRLNEIFLQARNQKKSTPPGFRELFIWAKARQNGRSLWDTLRELGV